MRAAIIRIVITGIAVFLAVMIVPGLQVDSFLAGIAVVLVLTILNLLVRPILLMLTLPLIIFSLGLFLIVVNALLLELTAYLVTGFSVTGFWPAVGGSIVISLVTMILNIWTSDRPPRERPSFPQRPPKIINPDE
ncbi:MAG TPA: phage holin family protein [Nitrospiraceae bacterium]|nr:phage holin family protein [Nitrospiraceae bacterium]